MLKKIGLATMTTAFLFIASPVWAQVCRAPSSQTAAATADVPLSQLVLALFGPDGMCVDTDFGASIHSAHFNATFREEFSAFNLAFANELTSLPLPSSATGFTYSFDPTVGAYTRTAQSFGPILTERAETIGRGRLSFSAAFQYFSFDEMEGTDLNTIPAVFTHDPVIAPGQTFPTDVIQTVNSIEGKVAQTTLFGTYGISDSFDVSLAIPIINVDWTIQSVATVRRPLGTNPGFHYFDPQGNGTINDTFTFRQSGSATGIGDIIVRGKGTVAKGEDLWVALGADVRLPSGDEEDLLGSGAFGLRPFAAISIRTGGVSPHVNLAYQYNAESVLAGDVQAGTKADLPDQLRFSAGVDFATSNWLSLAFDFLGKVVIDGQRLNIVQEPLADGSSLPQLAFVTDNYTTYDLATGFKANPGGNLLLDFNLIIKLNDTGLRDTLTPLFGLEYSF